MIHERLSGYEEAPLALSTSGHGTFRAMVTDAGIEYRLTYADTVGIVSQAHIHFGAVGQRGGISVFLCTNLGNGPAGTPACPAAGEVTGTIVAADVIGPVRPGHRGDGVRGAAGRDPDRHGVRQRAQLDVRRRRDPRPDRDTVTRGPPLTDSERYSRLGEDAELVALGVGQDGPARAVPQVRRATVEELLDRADDVPVEAVLDRLGLGDRHEVHGQHGVVGGAEHGAPAAAVLGVVGHLALRARRPTTARSGRGRRSRRRCRGRGRPAARLAGTRRTRCPRGRASPSSGTRSPRPAARRPRRGR